MNCNFIIFLFFFSDVNFIPLEIPYKNKMEREIVRYVMNDFCILLVLYNISQTFAFLSYSYSNAFARATLL